MDIKGHAAIVTGGGSGLGAATAAELAKAGAKVALLDVNMDAANAHAQEIGGIAIKCDVSDSASAEAAIKEANAKNGTARILINCAGIGKAGRIVGREGPMPLGELRAGHQGQPDRLVQHAAPVRRRLSKADALEEGERGVAINTASVAAYDGQIGQAAYSSSKGGIVGADAAGRARARAVRHPRLRHRARHLLHADAAGPVRGDPQKSLAASIPFPQVLGKPEQYAALARHIVENRYLNGEVIRLDGALRMAPK